MTRHREKAPSQRQLRVGEELRHALARTLTRGHFRDPELADARITVTEVRVSPDLRHAIAFVVPLGGRGIDDVVRALERAAGYLRGQLAHEVRLRYTPHLAFRADCSFDRAGRIDQVLRRPRVRRDLTEGEGNGHES